MSTRVEKLPLGKGKHVLIEVYDVEDDVQRVSVGHKAVKTFEAAWNTVEPVIQSLAKSIAACGPTETQIKFGIKIGADFDAIIASAKGEANFEVTLSWKPGK
jgi:hypothetical protein